MRKGRFTILFLGLIGTSIFLINPLEQEVDQPKEYIVIAQNKPEPTELKKEVGAAYDFSCDSATESNGKLELESTKQTKKQALIPFTTVQINPSRDTVLEIGDGSEIIIPAKSIHNQAGKPVTREVAIQYRTFYSATEIALSGIPMNLGDSAALLSGGMIELYAFQNKDSLIINLHKPIALKLATAVKSTHYNYYQLKSKSDNWVDKGDLEIDTTSTMNNLLDNVKWWEFTDDYAAQTGYFSNGLPGLALAVKQPDIQSFKKWATKKNIKKPSSATFYTLFSKRSFPQNAHLKYLAWHLSANNDAETLAAFIQLHDEKKSAAHSFWNYMDVSICGDEFTLQFSDRERTLSLNVLPSASKFPGYNSFQKRSQKSVDRSLMLKNRALHAIYKEGRKKVKSIVSNFDATNVRDFAKNNAIYKDEMDRLLDSRKFKLPGAKRPFRATTDIVDFGIHNIDAPIKYLAFGALNIATAPVQAAFNIMAKSDKRRYIKNRRFGMLSFKDYNVDQSRVDRVALIQKGVNTTRTFSKAKLNQFQFFNHYDNLGIVFMKDGSYCIIPPDQFKGYSTNDTQFQFETEVAENSDALKKLIDSFGFEI